MKPTRKKVLVVDSGSGSVVRDIPYLLHQAGCAVHSMCARGSWQRKTAHVDAWIPAPKDLAAYPAALSRVITEGTYDWVILGDDKIVRMVEDNMDAFPVLQTITPIQNIQHRAVLGSKAGLSNFCVTAGIATPAFVLGSSFEDVTEALATFSFPLLAKADQSAGGKATFLCQDAAAVQKLFARLPKEMCRDMVLQQYLQGGDVAVETLYRDGMLIAYAYSMPTGTVGGPFGPTRVRTYMPGEVVEPTLQKLGCELGLHGFASMTFVKDAAGEHYLIEVDTRPQVWFLPARLAGVDFTEAIKLFFSDETRLLKTHLAPGETIELRNFQRDIVHSIAHGDVQMLLRWVRGDGVLRQLIPTHDKRLLVATVLAIIADSWQVCIVEPCIGVLRRVWRLRKRLPLVRHIRA